MNRRIFPGVIAGLLAAAVLLTVGFGAYRAGQDHNDDKVVQVVQADGERGEASEGTEVVRVDRDRDWHGPRFGFFLFPLLVILVIAAILFWGRGRGWHGPPHWHGYGPYGSGPGRGPGWFEEWHRRAHEGYEGHGSHEAAVSPAQGPSGSSGEATPAPGTAPSSGASDEPGETA